VRRLLRILVLLVLAAAVVYVLFEHVFPWVDAQVDDPAVGATSR
jgi:hypothetical protein